MKISKIHQLINQGNHQGALDSIEKLSGAQKLQGKILKSRILEHMGNYQEAYQLALEAEQTATHQGRRKELIGALVSKSYALLRLSDYETMMETIKETRDLIHQHLPKDYQEVKRYNAILFNIEGLQHRLKGNLDQALERYRESYEISSKLNLKRETASCLTNMGTVHQIKGNLEKALNLHIDALQTFTELDDDRLVAYALHDIASIYRERGNLELAKSYYEKALNTRLNLPNNQNTAFTIFKLVQVNLEQDYKEIAKYYLDMLEEILEEDPDSQEIRACYDLSKASILKDSTRLIQRAKAQKLFRKYASEKRDSGIDHKLIRYAMLNLCDLLIIELKISKNEEHFREVEELSNNLLQLAKSQQSLSLLVETYLLKSKIALMNLNLEKAQKLLVQAETTAFENELYHLAIKVSAEHDTMIDKLNRWDDLKKRNASLIERVEAADLQATIDDLLTERQDMLQNQEETPLFILILNDEAVTIYSKKFDESVQVNEQLLGGFLVASNFSINQALDGQNNIERIKYGEYNIIFIQEKNLVFCYGFEGKSFFAAQRLQGFISRIKLGRSWELLLAKVPKPKKIKEELDPKIQDFFLSTTMLD